MKITTMRWWKLKEMFLRCLKIELLQKDRGTKVRMRIICERRR
jgi:hypothetical protein